jgi:hypothetical protein
MINLVLGGVALALVSGQGKVIGGGNVNNQSNPPVGSWQTLSHAPGINAAQMVLLTDGTVLVQDDDATDWKLLTPDANGNYQTGTFSSIASMNSARLYYAVNVLNDGRVFVSGGEYGASSEQTATEIYNPATNVWTTITPPSGWSDVGDAPSVTLPNGKVLLGSIADSRTAIFDPVSMSFSAGPNRLHGDTSTEESWTLMPDGTINSWDCIAHAQSQKYVTSSNSWLTQPSTTNDLVGPASAETGTGVLLFDGTELCVTATASSNNSTGKNCLYTMGATAGTAGSWSNLPQIGTVSIGGSTYVLGQKDAPSSIEPNGNVLLAVGPLDTNENASNDFYGPCYMYEYNYASKTFTSAPNYPGFNSSKGLASSPPFIGCMLLLPSGQILFTMESNAVYIYTPSGTYQSAWQPTISSVATIMNAGGTYPISGTQFNGLSGGSYYGDEGCPTVNYPLVRIQNAASGHVFYAKTHGHSTMQVATGSASVSTNLDVKGTTESGPSTLYVVADGIPSQGQTVYMFPANVVPATSYNILTGTAAGGNAQSLYYADANSLSVNRGIVFGTQTAPVQVQLNGTSSVNSPTSMTFTLTANANATGLTQNVYAYNYTTSVWTLIDTRTAPTSSSTFTATLTGTLSQYVNQSTGTVNTLVTCAPTSNGSANPYAYTENIDQAVWTIH